MARQLVLERIDEIAQNGHCRQTFGKEKIDLNLLRFTVEQTRFYDVAGRMPGVSVKVATLGTHQLTPAS
jgi:hypothetical protein